MCLKVTLLLGGWKRIIASVMRLIFIILPILFFGAVSQIPPRGLLNLQYLLFHFNDRHQEGKEQCSTRMLICITGRCVRALESSLPRKVEP
jgi:hypothetical protein